MASVSVATDPPTDIDYSLVDRRVRVFKLRGKVLYDEDEGIDIKGWKEELVKLVKKQGLDINDGIGLHAFVYGLIKEGLL